MDAYFEQNVKNRESLDNFRGMLYNNLSKQRRALPFSPFGLLSKRFMIHRGILPNFFGGRLQMERVECLLKGERFFLFEIICLEVLAYQQAGTADQRRDP